MEKIVTYSFILAIMSSLFVSCSENTGDYPPPEVEFRCFVIFRDAQSQDRMLNIPLGVVGSESKIEVVPSFASKEAMTFEILDTRAKELPINQDEVGRLNRDLWFLYNETGEKDYHVLKCDLGRPSKWDISDKSLYIEIKMASQIIFNDDEIHVLKIPKTGTSSFIYLDGDQTTFDQKIVKSLEYELPTSHYYIIDLNN